MFWIKININDWKMFPYHFKWYFGKGKAWPPAGIFFSSPSLPSVSSTSLVSIISWIPRQLLYSMKHMWTTTTTTTTLYIDNMLKEKNQTMKWVNENLSLSISLSENKLFHLLTNKLITHENNFEVKKYPQAEMGWKLILSIDWLTCTKLQKREWKHVTLMPSYSKHWPMPLRSCYVSIFMSLSIVQLLIDS